MMGHPSHPPQWGSLADLRPHMDRIDRRRRRRDVLLWCLAWAVWIGLVAIIQHHEEHEQKPLSYGHTYEGQP